MPFSTSHILWTARSMQVMPIVASDVSPTTKFSQKALAIADKKQATHIQHKSLPQEQVLIGKDFMRKLSRAASLVDDDFNKLQDFAPTTARQNERMAQAIILLTCAHYSLLQFHVKNPELYQSVILHISKLPVDKTFPRDFLDHEHTIFKKFHLMEESFVKNYLLKIFPQTSEQDLDHYVKSLIRDTKLLSTAPEIKKPAAAQTIH